jgi:hypothetical protein
LRPALLPGPWRVLILEGVAARFLLAAGRQLGLQALLEQRRIHPAFGENSRADLVLGLQAGGPELGVEGKAEGVEEPLMHRAAAGPDGQEVILEAMQGIAALPFAEGADRWWLQGGGIAGEGHLQADTDCRPVEDRPIEMGPAHRFEVLGLGPAAAVGQMHGTDPGEGEGLERALDHPGQGGWIEHRSRGDDEAGEAESKTLAFVMGDEEQVGGHGCGERGTRRITTARARGEAQRRLALALAPPWILRNPLARL